MKKTFCFLFLVSALAKMHAQSCCSPLQQFADLSQNPAFVSKHDDPIPFHYDEAQGKMITFACSDGKDGQAYAIEAKKKSDEYLLIFHEWWGLNDYIKKQADYLYDQLEGKVNVIAVDLYDGNVATEQKDAKTYMQNLSQERAKAIMQGAIDHAGKKAKIATIGWCMGGGYSMQASLLAGDHAVGCVMYYGMPETDVERLKQLNADVILFWGTQDKFINKDVVDQFQQNMNAAGKKLETHSYDADHAFANPSNPKYNKEAAAEANKLSLAFLKEKLL